MVVPADIAPHREVPTRSFHPGKLVFISRRAKRNIRGTLDFHDLRLDTKPDRFLPSDSVCTTPVVDDSQDI